MDTKIRSFIPNAHNAENFHGSLNESLSLLKAKKVNILYLHSPDRTTPFAETLNIVNEAYKEGKFEVFGLSNYTVEEIQAILDICDKNNWIRPTVYQGNYNAITRLNEERLFPFLRKEKIAFYAYSPVAGGFFTGKTLSKENIAQDGRFGVESKIPRIADLYRSFYFKDSYFKFLREYLEFIKPYGLNPIEIPLRWVTFHSQLKREYGDAIILGASTPSQLEENFKYIKKGPLPSDLVQYIENEWKNIKQDAPPYHY